MRDSVASAAAKPAKMVASAAAATATAAANVRDGAANAAANVRDGAANAAANVRDGARASAREVSKIDWGKEMKHELSLAGQSIAGAGQSVSTAFKASLQAMDDEADAVFDHVENGLRSFSRRLRGDKTSHANDTATADDAAMDAIVTSTRGAVEPSAAEACAATADAVAMADAVLEFAPDAVRPS